MNHLFHLITAGDDPDAVAGSIMGDFVKGKLAGGYPEGILRGLRLHRAVDSFAAQNIHWQRSRRCLDDSFGLYRGILVDIFYDHFLSRAWSELFVMPYETYLRQVRTHLDERRELLPELFRQLLPRMFEEWLPVYPEVEGIALVLQRMSGRLKRVNPLADGARELERQYRELEEDFRLFYPEVMQFAAMSGNQPSPAKPQT